MADFGNDGGALGGEIGCGRLPVLGLGGALKEARTSVDKRDTGEVRGSTHHPSRQDRPLLRPEPLVLCSSRMRWVDQA